MPSPPDERGEDVIRNFQTTQIPGLYRNIPIPPYSAACGDAIRIRQVEPTLSTVGLLLIIPHQLVSLPFDGGGEQKCTASEVSSPVTATSATVLRRSKDLTPLDSNNTLIRDFILADESFFLGVEVGARRCGGLALASDSVSMWVAPKRVVQSQAGSNFRVNFKPGSKYIYYFSTSSPCVYRGNANEQAQFVNVPRPSASPSPSAAAAAATAVETADVTLLSPIPLPPGISPAPLGAPAPLDTGPVAGGGEGVASVGAPALNGLDGVQLLDDGSVQSFVDTASQRACFPAGEQVWLSDGRVVRMESVKLHDEVLVDDSGGGSAIMSFTHRNSIVLARFVRIHTQHKRSLTLSGGHIVLVGREMKAKTAQEVRVGDSLTDVEHGASAVTNVEWVVRRGLFNPQPVQGRLVVHGIVVSAYTSALPNSGCAHALLTPLRFVYALYRLLSL